MREEVSSWDRVISFDSLLAAYYRARCGKRGRLSVARFGLDLEDELFRLQDELCSGRWRPGPFRQFIIHERKPRLISAAPFRDRVVHHAVMSVVEPCIEQVLINDTFACRQGKGVHKAVNRYQQWAVRHAYVLKFDIARYFPSIRHDLLKRQLATLVDDVRILELLGRIIDASPPGGALGCGLPIGNLTSQAFANLYLSGVDHIIKNRLCVQAYLRYVDDLFLLSDDKAFLWDAARVIASSLRTLGLKPHLRKVSVQRTSEWVDVLGYKVSRGRRRLRNDNGHRFRRRFERLAACYSMGRIPLETVTASVRAWIGHARHADTEGLRRVIFGKVCLTPPSG